VLLRDGWRIEGKQAIPFCVCPLSIQVVWGRVLLAQHRPAAAAVLLQLVLEEFRREQPQANTLPLVALLAVALAASGADEQALSLLAGAWPSASTQGYIRTFVDEGPPIAALLRQVMLNGDAPGVEDLLAAFPPDLVEEAQLNAVGLPAEASLSAREVEVMRLMAVGLSNQEIADELVVALSTVRSHMKHIYRKLAVQGRVRAVARATALHLL
jgi:LuxR family maltose regulon positive regulatory protein